MKLCYFILFFVFYRSNADYPTDCAIEGLFCVMDGQHDYQYLECSTDFKGFRDCAVGTKCAGEQDTPYTYNPCIIYSTTSSSSQPTESSGKPVSSEQKPISSEQPITPSTGTVSSQSSTQSDQSMCKEDGFFCVMNGEHDYEYLECSEGYKGFRPCALGTKCAGEKDTPYTYNPCVVFTSTQSEQQSSIPTEQSSTKPVSSEQKPASSEQPITPSTGTVSSESSAQSQQNPIDCSVDGFFCVDDGQHDYQYLECSIDYKGYRPCAPGTKCAGANNNPYTYNPCVSYPYTPSEQQSTESSTKPVSSEQKPASSEQPITPSTGTVSSESSTQSQQSESICKEDGFFCVDDGEHDYEYLECSVDFKGFRPCAVGTKCAGKKDTPYTYNPCVAYPYTPSEQPTESSTKPISSEEPITPSTGTVSSENTTSSESKQPVPTDCSVDGFFCVDDGQHDYQYLECSEGYKGFRPCAVGTKCAGANNNPYTYNPCISYPYTPSEQQSSTESSTKPVSSEEKSESSEEPITPSTGTVSSENTTSSESKQPVPTDCSVDGFFCVDDGQHDFQYLECSAGYKGFRPCAPGTKCAGANNNPYTYNPCIAYPYTPSEQQSSTESGSKSASSEEPITPSTGTVSSENTTSSESKQPVPTDCSVDGFFCVDDGQHDYQYLECSEGYKGFRPCAVGTKCAGAKNNPYTYNPCIAYPYTPSEQQSSTESSSKPASSEEPITPSTGTVSSENTTSSESKQPVPTDCSVDGFFCVDDGQHDFQYLECSEGYKGFRPCAVGTKCAGESNNPYTYNPCIAYPYTPSEQQSEQSSTKPASSEEPITPSTGNVSSEESTQSESKQPVPTDCSVDGFFCVDDGQHDYQYLECSEGYKGFRQCAPGTKCAGANNNPYTYNPCISYPYTPSEQQSSTESSTKPTSSEQKPVSSEEPTTPSIGGDSSETSSQSQQIVPTDCSVDGFFCVDDGQHDYQYLECSIDYKGFRQCAPGTKCAGQQNNPYTYNPCISYPYTPSEQSTESSTKPVSSEQKPASSEEPITPSTGTVSSESSTQSQQSESICKEDGFFCVMNGEHDYEYLECSEGYKGFRPCAPGTKCAGEQDEPYKFNPCVIYESTQSEHSDESKQSEQQSSTPTTPSVGTSSEEQTSTQSQEEYQSCGDFECQEDGLYCQIDGQRNNRYCECAQTFKGSRPCAPGTWCQGKQDAPYEYNPCVFIDQTSWFGNVTKTLPQ